MGIKQITPIPTNCRSSNSKDIHVFKRFCFELFLGSHASFPSDILIIKTSGDVISTATTNIPRIFELNLSSLLVWITALVRYFSTIFNYAQKRSCGQPRTELFPAVYEMSTFMLGRHILTIRNEIQLFLQLPTPGPCSFHPLPSSHPSCSRLTLSLTLRWHNMELVFATENFLKLTTDLLPPPRTERESQKTEDLHQISHCSMQLCGRAQVLPVWSNTSHLHKYPCWESSGEGRLSSAFTSRYVCLCKKHIIYKDITAFLPLFQYAHGGQSSQQHRIILVEKDL